MSKLIVRAGREKSLLRRHPWIFSGAIKSSGGARNGEVVLVQAEDGRFLCHAIFSEGAQIAARAVSFVESDIVDAEFFAARVQYAVRLRSAITDTDAVRLIHGESDGLPGVVADRYADRVVVQLTTAGIEPHRDVIADALIAATGAKTVFERSDVDVRALEGLAPRVGLLRGAPLDGDVQIHENGMSVLVDIAGGHKTGFYLDQRVNRALTQSLARDRDVLNCFCYTGTMSVAAAMGGARSVLSIDSSGPALEQAKRHAEINHVDATPLEWWEADVFQALRKLRDSARQFDLIILDPPKLAPTAHHVEKASRAYKDINLLGFKLLRPGGLLMTYSCSGGLGHELFQKIVAGAAVDAKVDAQLLQRLGPGADHPVSVHFPEGDYLKGLLLRRTA